MSSYEAPSIAEVVLIGEGDALPATASLRCVLRDGGELTWVVRRFARALPYVFGPLYAVTARRRFGHRPDIRAVTAYVREVADRGADNWPPREMEASLRGVLGEPEVGTRLSDEDGWNLRAGLQLIRDTFEGRPLSDDEIGSIFLDIGTILRSVCSVDPDLAIAADQWDRVRHNLASADEETL